MKDSDQHFIIIFIYLSIILKIKRMVFCANADRHKIIIRIKTGVEIALFSKISFWCIDLKKFLVGSIFSYLATVTLTHTYTHEIKIYNF